MNVLLLTAHDIAEYDDVRMFADMGVDVFSIGAYSDPRIGSKLRPPLPDAPYHPDLIAFCEEQRVKHAGQPTEFGIVDWAKADLHPALIEWADAIIVHHFIEAWVQAQWHRIKHKRVIWRTCGQSNPRLEMEMAPFHEAGLQIVRYSPAEERAFTRYGTWAGQDALIRFGKYPADYGPWIGDWPVVGNVTQNMDLRGDHCGYDFWMEATKGLPVKPAGTGSERLPGGVGELSYPDMLDYLRHIRSYLYTGTQPASYTLGLIEAMLSGVPVVSIGPEGMWIPDLFEGHEIVEQPEFLGAAKGLHDLLVDMPYATSLSYYMRARAADLFDVAHIAPQWADFLGIAPAVTYEAATSV